MHGVIRYEPEGERIDCKAGQHTYGEDGFCTGCGKLEPLIIEAKAAALREKMKEFSAFPGKHCGCHWNIEYGFVPEMDCPEHDTKEFLEFLEFIRNVILKGVP